MTRQTKPLAYGATGMVIGFLAVPMGFMALSLIHGPDSRSGDLALPAYAVWALGLVNFGLALTAIVTGIIGWRRKEDWRLCYLAIAAGILTGTLYFGLAAGAAMIAAIMLVGLILWCYLD